jgi:predicted nucleic acid-binding protein
MYARDRLSGGHERVHRCRTGPRARFAYDEHVAEHLASLIADLRRSGRRAGVMDCIIGATALVHDLVVWTQDSDYDVLASVAPALRVHHG